MRTQPGKTRTGGKKASTAVERLIKTGASFENGRPAIFSIIDAGMLDGANLHFQLSNVDAGV